MQAKREVEWMPALRKILREERATKQPIRKRVDKLLCAVPSVEDPLADMLLTVSKDRSFMWGFLSAFSVDAMTFPSPAEYMAAASLARSDLDVIAGDFARIGGDIAQAIDQVAPPDRDEPDRTTKP
ncbi:MAG: hypothetical protein ACOYOB_18835 [Myxococcota bacterium]